jgi:hypothetical protein
MKKYLFLIAAIPSLVYGGLNSTCDEYTKNRINAFKISKSVNKKNVLHFSVAVDMKNCVLSSNNPVVKAYWVMGEKRMKDRSTSCEAMTKKEIPKFLGFKNQAAVDLKMSKKIDNKTIELEIPNLENLGEKMGKNTTFSRIVTVNLINSNGVCNAVTTGVRNSHDIVFDQIDFKISFLSLKKVTITRDGKSI